MKINSNLVVLLEEEHKIVLKIQGSETVVKLSPIEWEVIQKFAHFNDMDSVIEAYKDKISISKDTLEKLVTTAKENLVLLEDSEVVKKPKWSRLTLKRHKVVFELLNLDLTNSWLEKLIEKKIVIGGILSTIAILTFSLLLLLITEPLNFKKNYLETLYLVPVSFNEIAKYIYLVGFITVGFHELGHYLLYKMFGGKTTVFGFGLLFFLLPIAYTRVLTSLIPKKSQRIAVNFGGIVFDAILLVFILHFTKIYHTDYPITSFLLYCMIVSICIRTVFNLNFLLPNTDGYFIFTELINKPNLFKESTDALNKVYKTKRLARELAGLYLYGILAILSIVTSWIFFLMPFILYFYYAVLH